MADLELEELVAGHLARFPGSALSVYDVARALRLPQSAGSGGRRLWRVLAELEEQGRAVRVTGPASETDSRIVTRWRMA